MCKIFSFCLLCVLSSFNLVAQDKLITNDFVLTTTLLDTFIIVEIQNKTDSVLYINSDFKFFYNESDSSLVSYSKLHYHPVYALKEDPNRYEYIKFLRIRPNSREYLIFINRHQNKPINKYKIFSMNYILAIKGFRFSSITFEDLHKRDQYFPKYFEIKCTSQDVLE